MDYEELWKLSSEELSQRIKMADHYEEIFSMLENHIEKEDNFQDHMRDKLEQIHTQAVKTNGRVNQHDKDISRIDAEIKRNHSKIDSIELKLARWGGVFTALNAVIAFVINYTLK